MSTIFKPYTILILFLMQGFQGFPQSIAKTSKNIYEYGTNIVSYDANFKNLWNNWNSKKIGNPNSLLLLNYCPVETLSNQDLIDKYVTYMTGDEALLSSIHTSSTIGSHQTARESKTLNAFTMKSLVKGQNEKAVEIERDSLRKQIRSLLHLGDQVYAVLLRTDRGIYTNFVICNENTRRVVWDNLFFNLRFD